MNKDVILLYYPLLNPDKGERPYHWFPYSLLPLAQSLNKSGYKPIIIDRRISDNSSEIIEKYKDSILFIGVSVMSGYQILDGLRIAEKIRTILPNTPIIWGGWHPTILPEETSEHPLVDIALSGRGEETIIHLAAAIKNNGSISSIKGISYKEGGRIIFTGLKTPSTLVDDAQAYENYIKIESYINPETRAVGYYAGHGCPFKCAFCSRHFMTNKMLTYEVEKIIDDITYFYKKFGFRHIHFQDDTLFVNLNRVFGIAERIIKSNLQITWWANVRADTFHKLSYTEIGVLIASGMKSVFIGVESASDELLKVVNKKIKSDDIIKTNEIMKNYNVKLHLSYMLGLPGDDIEKFKLTIEQIRHLKNQNKNVFVQTCFFQPYPGTPLYQKAIDCGYQKINGLENWGNLKPQSELEKIPWLSEKEMDLYRKEYWCLRSLIS